MATPKKDPKDLLKVGAKSKFKIEFCKLAYRHCILGATDKDLAQLFETTEKTINDWKLAHPEFSESLKKGKIEADMRVAKSLFKRANGYGFKEITFEDIEERIFDHEGNIKLVPKTRVKTVFKQQAPDVTAQIFWLKNRQPKNWRDKTEVDNNVKIVDVSDTQFKIVRRKK